MDVELGATVLRKGHISSRNPDCACLVKDWQQKHPGATLPKAFLLHIRCAGALQRDGPVLLAPLPAKLVVPGSHGVPGQRLQLRPGDKAGSRSNPSLFRRQQRLEESLP